MAYEVSWLIEGQVIYTRSWGEGSEEDMRNTMTQTITLISSSSRPYVHVVSDNRDLTSVPSMVVLAKVAREIPIPDHAGWLVTVQTANPVLRFFTDVVTQIMGRRYRSFKTLGEALQFLKTIDETVEWDKLPEAFKVV